MVLAVQEAAKRIQVAVSGLAQRGLMAEAIRLIDWFQARPCVRTASQARSTTITLDPWTELVLVHVEQMVSATPMWPQEALVREMRFVYRSLGIPDGL